MSPASRGRGSSVAARTLLSSASLLLLALVLTPFAAPAPAPAPQGPASYEYDVKAVFLYHFTQYLQWPEDSASEAFTIVVFGESDIVPPLEAIARTKTVGPKPIVIRQCFEIGQIGRPRILFIAKSAVPRIAQVLAHIRGSDVLTVGEADGLGSRGVAINFVLRDGAVKFEMSEKALKEARILAGSQLLKLAILVDQDTGTR